MTLSKISLRNVRRSIRDYAIYFFTLILGVSIFYVFNAIVTQTAFLNISEDTRELIDLLRESLSAISVFVAFVLGALVVYASRFLIKRRNREFAVYMILGMGKRKTALILLLETLLIGGISLVVGLLVGVGLSQVMSTFVVDMFAADMTKFRFTFSYAAFVKTILYFGIIMVIVLIFEVGAVGKSRLITLLQSDKKQEQKKPIPPVISLILFAVGVVLLVWAYKTVLVGINSVTRSELILSIVFGCVSTFLIFYSLSGLLLFFFSKRKECYYRGVNVFTFRQITGRMYTMVVSMSVICIMLFLTLCILSSAFSIKDSLNKDNHDLAPADVNIIIQKESEDGAPYLSVEELLKEKDPTIMDAFASAEELFVYQDPSVTYGDFFGEDLETVQKSNPYLLYDTAEMVVRVSDYNRLATIYGAETYELGSDEYLMVCNFNSSVELRNYALKRRPDYQIFGTTLHAAKDHCVEGFLRMEGTHTNTGFFLAPDDVIPSDAVPMEALMAADYAATEKEAIRETDARIDALATEMNGDENALYEMQCPTRTSIMDQSVGLGAIVAFLGLYIGIVFLISAAAVLALKSMSEQLDSKESYQTLRRIGVTEHSIFHSLFLQEGIFFLMPLVLAMIHAFVGIKSVESILGIFGAGILDAIFATAGIIVLIYGGYFVITYFSSKMIIQSK